MIRFVLCIAMLATTCSFASAQTRDEILGPGAVQAMESARRQAHSVTLDSTYAARLVGTALADVNSLPAEYARTFDRQVQQMRDGLTAAVTAHAKGDFYKAGADGGYNAVKQRVATGNWLGVTDVANDVTRRYYIAYAWYSSAGSGYGAVASEARSISRAVQEIRNYLSMLQAFEDFYGPTGP